ncbi:hypothetical protein SAMN05216359_105251 [Roseateles sp. YR242]|uniref:hypothetical protein n=1 Tax=Roseateles sp. YR242 TaxID=1855305 RepID=UPI0008D662AC|nr:hypothetical protein [Roseateles sp. YR242]SEL11593.1 hypothetical protein SAMN05216359_105251 [Roseateles sp. YR242]
MKRSNCLIWAVCLYLRRRRKGDASIYLSVRRSRWGRFPHFLVMRQRRDGLFRAVSYKPIHPQEKKLPPPVFRGRSRWGDL